MTTTLPETHGTHEEDVVVLPLKALTPAPDNPRRDVGELGELAQSISSVGLLEPLLVTPSENGSGYLVVCGARRLAAAKLAGLDPVPAIVRDLDAPARAAAMLVENLQREDLSALEEASAYQRLLDEFGYSQRQLAAQVGRAQSHISKRLALVELPEKARAELDSGGITIEDALELTRLTQWPKKVETLLRQGQRGASLHYQVDHALEEEKRKETVAAATAKLKEAGAPLVAWKSADPWYPQLPAGHAEVRKGNWSGVDMDPKKHAKEPCHAVAVHPRTAETVEFCSDPKRHPRPKAAGESNDEKFKREQAKRQAEREALEQAATARRAFAGELIGKSRPAVPKAEAVEQIVRGFLAYVGEWADEETWLACELLGDPIDEEAVEGPSPLEVLREQLDAGENGILRVGLALAMGSAEAGVGSLPPEPYLDFLTRQGYKLSAAEKAAQKARS